MSLSSVVIRNASKRFAEISCEILLNSLILSVFLGVENSLSPLSELLFCLAVSYAV